MKIQNEQIINNFIESEKIIRLELENHKSEAQRFLEESKKFEEQVTDLEQKLKSAEENLQIEIDRSKKHEEKMHEKFETEKIDLQSQIEQLKKEVF